MGRINKMRNVKIRDLCTKDVNEVVSENIKKWHGNVRRKDENSLNKRIYKNKCRGKIRVEEQEYE